MKHVRSAAVIATIAISVAAPAGALASGSPPSQLTSTAPTRLSSPTSTTTTPTRTLPYTGLNLLPETVVGLVLLGAGVGLRARRSRA